MGIAALKNGSKVYRGIGYEKLDNSALTRFSSGEEESDMSYTYFDFLIG
ncbi:hypothetical protein [Paenibacillus amylolyticus]